MGLGREGSTHPPRHRTRSATHQARAYHKHHKNTQRKQPSRAKTEAEIATEKYGLEAGLFKALTSKEEDGGAADGSGSGAAAGLSRTEQAKQLLARYGGAYLATSISFAVVSFAACYAAVSAGVDVAALLARVGLTVSDTSEKVGTFAIAYAAHKALSPVRFPPTVALTPVVARWLGKAPAAAGEGGSNGSGDSNGNGAGKQ